MYSTLMINIFKWSTQWYSNKNIHTILRLTVWQWILSSVLFQTQRTYSVLKECSRTPGALGRNRTNSSVNSLKAFQSRTTENQRGNNDVSKKVQEIIIIINILITCFLIPISTYMHTMHMFLLKWDLIEFMG